MFPACESFMGFRFYNTAVLDHLSAILRSEVAKVRIWCRKKLGAAVRRSQGASRILLDRNASYLVINESGGEVWK